MPLPHSPQGRACGHCALCCKVCAVAGELRDGRKLEKPALAWCPHARPDRSGCLAYAERPDGCRVFHCAWLLGGFADGDRPDKLGLVIFGARGTPLDELSPGGVTLMALEAHLGASAQPRAKFILEKLGSRGPVVVTLADKRQKIVCPEAMKAAIAARLPVAGANGKPPAVAAPVRAD